CCSCVGAPWRTTRIRTRDTTRISFYSPLGLESCQRVSGDNGAIAGNRSRAEEWSDDCCDRLLVSGHSRYQENGNRMKAQQRDELLAALKGRFDKNAGRHKGIAWEKVVA